MFYRLLSISMKFLIISFSMSLLVGISLASSVFNAEELMNVHYDVDIVGEPKLTTELSSSGTSMTLLSKHGQRYECILPSNVYTLGSSALPVDESLLKQKEIEAENERKAVSSVVYIPKLLDGMKDGPCLRLSKGWWEYELCFRQRIRQYHRNEQTGAVENEIILGEFVSDFDWKSAEVSMGLKKDGEASSRQRGPRSHTQEYDHGSVCDLTGTPRRAQVVYHCDLSPHAIDSLADVEEPASCIYRLTVKTPRLCSNPLLRRAAEEQMPSRRRPPETIQCRPLLAPESMRRYKEVQAAKAAAIRRAAEAERLRAIYRDNRLQRDYRIRKAVTAWLGGPLRRRKFGEMARMRYRRLRNRLAAAETAASVADSVLSSARRLSSQTEASIKAITKRLKAKFRALRGKEEGKAKEEEEAKEKKKEEEGKEDEENMELFRKTMAALPEDVRKRLTSSEGLATLKSGLGSQFQQILNDAKREVGGETPDVNQQDVIGRMSEMIDKILAQVDAAGRRLDKETMLMDALTSQQSEKEKKSKDSGGPGTEEQAAELDRRFKKDKNRKKKKEEKEKETKKKKEKMEEKNKKEEEEEPTEISPIPSGKALNTEIPASKEAAATGIGADDDAKTEPKEATPEKPQMSSAEVERMRGRLETELRQKMERRGFETSNVMLHVMTMNDRAGDGDGGDKKEKPSFVGIIILKNDQQQREEERMRRLEKNYNFRIDEAPAP